MGTRVIMTKEQEIQQKRINMMRKRQEEIKTKSLLKTPSK
jgi:hypothetical protein